MASGETLIVFTPHQYEPPATNYATLDTRNSHRVLNFDSVTQETAVFKSLLPRHYDGGGITVYIHASCDATTGTLGWILNFERVSDSQQDIDSDGFANDQTVTAVTVPGTSGLVDIVSLAVANGTNLDSIAVGDGFRFKVRRDVDNDTAAGNGNLWIVELVET